VSYRSASVFNAISLLGKRFSRPITWSKPARVSASLTGFFRLDRDQGDAGHLEVRRQRAQLLLAGRVDLVDAVADHQYRLGLGELARSPS
jgi:hypothetical protein